MKKQMDLLFPQPRHIQSKRSVNPLLLRTLRLLAVFVLCICLLLLDRFVNRDAPEPLAEFADMIQILETIQNHVLWVMFFTICFLFVGCAVLRRMDSKNGYKPAYPSDLKPTGLLLSKQATVQVNRSMVEISFTESFDLYRTPWSRVASEAICKIHYDWPAIRCIEITPFHQDSEGYALLEIHGVPECTQTVNGSICEMRKEKQRQLLGWNRRHLYAWVPIGYYSEIQTAIENNYRKTGVEF